MRGFAIAVSVLLSVSPISADSLTIGNGLVQDVNFGNPSLLQQLGKASYMIWINATETAARRFISKVNFGYYPFTTAGDVEANQNTTGISVTYNTTSPPSVVTVGIWKCIGITFDNGAAGGDKFKFYHGTSTSSIVSEPSSVTSAGTKGVFDDGSSFSAGASGGASLGGDYGFIMVSTGIMTLADFQDQQFNPHVTTGTLLLSFLWSASSPTAFDMSGNANNGTFRGVTFSANGPPIYFPEAGGF